MIDVVVAVGPGLLCEAIAVVLQQYPDVNVVQRGRMTGSELVEVVGPARPDVALLDYFMPDMHGPELTRAVLSAAPGTKVLLLSWCHSPDQVREALNAGAVGFLPKSLTVSDVVDAIRHAHDGKPLVFAAELARLLEDYDQVVEQGEELYARLTTLTKRELEILNLLAQGGTSKQVAVKLGITPATLKNHMSKVLTKTGAHTRLDAMNLARMADLIPPLAEEAGPNR